MKYLVSLLVTMGVMLVLVKSDPGPERGWPEWVNAIAWPIMITLPLCLLSRLLTKKIGGIAARAADLTILFCVIGAFWLISTDLTAGGLVRSPFRFWLRLTTSSWAVTILPFIASTACFEWFEAGRKKAIP